MSVPEPSALLARVTRTVSYVRVTGRADADPATVWHRCSALVGDPSALMELVRSTAAGRGTDRDDIALSLFCQAYAFRVAATAIGSWLMSGGAAVLDVSPANMSIALGRHRPNAVALDRIAYSRHGIAEALFDRHLVAFVANAHSAIEVGKRLLWGNMAAGCAAAFGAFHAVLGPDVRAQAARFTALAPEPLALAGQFVEYEGTASVGWFFERNACCLLYQVQPPDPAKSPTMCEDCPLHSAEARLARYRAATSTACDDPPRA
ncbi:MAG: hypothetical protein F4Z41_10140 [Acidimicrobiia bacterium]|nr:hypothetical protein [bacterium]MXW68461.1 hypothetical protein [Acidimicrobiia bacterium]MDE0675657.1 hypothetical protein [bacterium]MXX46543.1 hypothetical protein [Acidimicrobiia bacterium]MYA39745.1 hypothetical protein [Acidimicrobiia bacterium]